MVGARSRARCDHGQITSAGLRTARAERLAAALQGQVIVRRQDLEEIASGYERPAVMPIDPAIAAEQRFEQEFVREKRAARVSWFNIAQMTGKTVPYLQALYGEADQ